MQQITNEVIMSQTPLRSYRTRIATAFRLRCPACHEGKLFSGLLRMNSQCPTCQLPLEPEPGFYLGAIYANYGATALLSSAGFILLVFGFGVSKDVVVWICAAFVLVFSLWFFRYARSVWLSLMYQMNSSDFRKTTNALSPDRTVSPSLNRSIPLKESHSHGHCCPPN